MLKSRSFLSAKNGLDPVTQTLDPAGVTAKMGAAKLGYLLLICNAYLAFHEFTPLPTGRPLKVSMRLRIALKKNEKLMVIIGTNAENLRLPEFLPGKGCCYGKRKGE